MSAGLDSIIWLRAVAQGAYTQCERIPHQGLHATVVAVSVDAGLVASDRTNEPRSIALWGLKSGELLGHFRSCSATVSALAFSPDGQWLASGGHDGVINLWQVEDRKCVARLRGHTEMIKSLSWRPDGKWIASCASDHTICIWDACYRDYEDEDYQYDPRDGHTGRITSIRFSPNSQKLVSGSEDGTVRIWDPYSAQCIMVLLGHELQVNQVAWSDDGRWIASAGEDATVRLWSATTGECVWTMHRHRNSVNALAFAPRPPPGMVSGSSSDSIPCLVTAGDDCSVRIWRPFDDSDDDVRRRENVFLGRRRPVSVSWNPTAECVAVCGGLQTDVWNLTIPEDHQSWEPLAGCPREVNCACFAPLSNLLASGGDDCSVRIWEVDRGKRCRHELLGHDGGVTGLAWSPDEAYLASASMDATIRIWDVQTGACVITLTCGVSAWFDVAWSSDGKFIAGAAKDGCVYVWQRRVLPVSADIDGIETKSSAECNGKAGVEEGAAEPVALAGATGQGYMVKLYSILGNKFAPNFEANWEHAKMETPLAQLLESLGEQAQQHQRQQRQSQPQPQTSKCSIV